MNRVHRLTERDLNRLVRRVISEQDSIPPRNKVSQGSQSLPDCKQFIIRNAKGGDRRPGSSPMLNNVNVEYFIDGGPGNETIFIHVNGRRACKMR
jgi:hypothetical protein